MMVVEIVELRIVDSSTERQVELRMAIMHALEVGIRYLPAGRRSEQRILSQKA
jgi:hypothetical protein